MDREGMVHLLRRLAALERRVSALFRTGKVAEVQLSPYRVRVDIGPDDEGGPVLTDLLPVAVERAGEVRTWSPLTVGERVEVLSPGGEDASAFVRPALISEDFGQYSERGENVSLRCDALGAPGTLVGTFGFRRGETAATTLFGIVVGRAGLNMVGDGRLVLRAGASRITMTDTDITITNATASITLSGSDVTVAAARVDYEDP